MNYKLNKICLGTAQFASEYGLTNVTGGLSNDEISAILRLGKENQICFLDTAPTYGAAEIKLGNVGVSDWEIITKVKIGNKITESDSFIQGIYDSLERLKVDSLYGVLVHNPRLFFDPNINRLLEELVVLKSNGIIKKIGVSVYDSFEVDHILSHFDVDIVQIPFNIIDARMLINGTLAKLKHRSIEVHARSVYLQGLLLMSLEEQIQKFSKWNSLWYSFSEFCSYHKITPLQACLRYVLKHAEIDKVIIGIDNYTQLADTIQSAIGDMYEVPLELHTYDENLCNPLNWEMYAHLRFS